MQWGLEVARVVTQMGKLKRQRSKGQAPKQALPLGESTRKNVGECLL